MSHFPCLVILPAAAKNDIESTLESALAPFNENDEVEEYETECYCVGQKAVDAVREITLPKIQALREPFGKAHPLPAYAKHPFDLTAEDDEKHEEAWEAYIKPAVDEQQAMLKAHPDYGKPDAKCEDCKGSGKIMSTTNPQGYWDWYSIGGRWTGALDGYDPAKDPDNIEVCDLCKGSGRRHPDVPGCNGCNGEGKSVKWPTQWKEHQGDVQPVSSVLQTWDNYRSFFSIVTPDGKWHAKAKMGWFGMSRGKTMNNAEWREKQKVLLADYPDHIAVLCDLHV